MKHKIVLIVVALMLLFSIAAIPVLAATETEIEDSIAPWKSFESGSLCVRRRSRTGVRSAPPPNHWRLVTTMRVFICTAGTFGFRI